MGRHGATGHFPDCLSPRVTEGRAESLADTWMCCQDHGIAWRGAFVGGGILKR